MFCSGCGSPISAGLSYCNRCGMNLKERNESKPTSGIGTLVTAMVIIAVAAMGMLLGGPIALKREVQFNEDIIALFMFLIFFIGGLTEIFLNRQLSRLTTTKIESRSLPPATPTQIPVAQPRSLAEPMPSVTENTTRTLQYSHEERRR